MDEMNEMDGSGNLAWQFLDRHLEAGHEERPALLTAGATPNTTYPYGELADQSNRAAGVFRDLGVGRREHVLLALPNGPELVAALLGALRLGAVATPVNPLSQASELLAVIQDCAPRVLVVDELALGELKQCRQHVRPEGLLVVGETAPAWSWRHRIEDVEPHAETPEGAPEDPVVLLYAPSPGGELQSVYYRQEHLLHWSQQVGRRLVNIDCQDRVYSTLPIWSAWGLLASLALPLSAGAATVLESQEVTAEAAVGAIARFRPSLFFTATSLYSTLLQTPGEFDLTSLRQAIAVGESLPAEVARRFRERFGLELLHGLSLDEMAQVAPPGME